MSTMFQIVRESKNALAPALFFILLLTLSACDGTGVPGGFSHESETSFKQGDNAPMMLDFAGFIGGDPGDGSVNALSVFGNQTSRATTPDGELIVGANGVELKDLGWVNLFNSGLSSTPLPEATVRFFAEGGTEPLTSLPTLESTGLFNHEFDARALRSGSRLILEMEVRGEISRLQLPLLNLHDGDQLGFNALRRADGSMVAELFIDAKVNATGALGADGRADNGIRIVVDNGTDVTGDGEPDTAARMDTIDGLSFFDLNLDGLFGDPDLDALTYLDTTRDGFADTPRLLATDEQLFSVNDQLAVSFLYDPELDGIRENGAERDFGEGTAADLIESVEAQLTPSSVSANGLDTSTLGISVRPTSTGLPLDAALEFGLSRQGGNLAGSLNDVHWTSSDGRTSGRVLTPADPEVRLLSDGTFVLNESLVAPLLATESVSATTRVEVTLDVADRVTTDPIHQDFTLKLTRSMAPKLSRVNILGQIDISNQQGNLETLSRRARLVWGDPVQIIGENFSTTAEANIVAVNGVPATDVVVNPEGTQLDFTIPRGATSGPITVAVNGLGGRTSKDLIIAGEDFEVSMVSPEPSSTENVQIPANAYFSLAMTRDVLASSATADAVYLREAGTTNRLNWIVEVIRAGRTVHLTPNGTPLEAGKSYELVMTSNLIADGTDPVLRFDALPNAPLGSQIEERVLGTYDALGTDNFGAEVREATPAQGSTMISTDPTIVLEFNEPLDVSSVDEAVKTDNIALRPFGTEENVEIEWHMSSDLRTITLYANERLQGGLQYEVYLNGPALHDRAANGLNDGDYSLTFTTALDIYDISPRSGPPGSTLKIEGGDFGLDPQDVRVRIGGVLMENIEFFSDRRIDVLIPEGLESGLVQVDVNGETAFSRVPFTVTLPLIREDLPGTAGSRPIGIAVSGDDSRVFISNQGTGSISAYDLNALTPVDADNNPENGTDTPIYVGSVPSEVVFSRDASLLLTLDYGTRDAPGDSFFIVNAQDAIGEPEGERYGLAATVAVGRRPTRIAGSPDGWRWYVTNFLDDTLSVITAESPYQVAATIPTGDGPNGVGIAPDGKTGYICNYIDGTVTIFDPLSFTTLGEVPVGIAPARALVSGDGRWVFVSCFGDNSLHIISVADKRNVGSIPTNRAPAAMALSRDGSQLYLCSREQDTVTIYDISEDEDGMALLTSVGDVAAGRTPSGIATTTDGSRLIVAAEDGGFASVIYLQSPRHKITNMVREDGAPARSWDVGGEFCVKGTGFDPDPLNNTVLFNGEPAEIIPEKSMPGCIVIRVPAGATSGAVTVLVGGQESNGIDCIVHPDAPKVIRATPHMGARDVDPNAALVVRFNEPVAPRTGDIELVQLEDTFTFPVSGTPTRNIGQTIPGSFLMRDFDKELVFRPDAALPIRQNSNNWYRLRIKRTVADLVGTPMQRPVNIDFQLVDTRGPSLLIATYADLDNNGVDQNDLLELIFDEEVVLPEALQGMVVPSNLVRLSDSTSFGTGATLTTPLLELYGDSGLRPTQLSKTLGIRLGVDANLLIPGARTAIESLTNLSGDLAITDASGNGGLLMGNPNDIDLLARSVVDGVPLALGAVLIDGNGDELGEEGERLRIYLTHPMSDISAIDPMMIEMVGTGSLGDFTIERGRGVNFNDRQFDIVFGASASFDIAGGDRIRTTRDLHELRAFDDQPLRELDPAMMNFRVGLPADGPQILNMEGSVRYEDTSLPPGVSAGDRIIVRFSEPIRVGRAKANQVFSLSVQGDSFGQNAIIRPMPSLPDAMQIVLGANAKLRPSIAAFDPVNTAFGAASGLDIKVGLPLWSITNAFGQTARPDETNGPFGIASADMTQPLLIAARLQDMNGDGISSAGDKITVVFSEPVLRMGAGLADFTLMRDQTGFDFGAGAIFARGSRTFIDGDTFNITLGSSPTLPMEPGVVLGIAPGNPIADGSGNTVDEASSSLIAVSIAGTPKLLSATFTDVSGDGVNAGDLIVARFNQATLLDSNKPSDAFAMPSPSDSFGNGASMAYASVTQAMIDAGLTKRGVGETDRKLVLITLGSNAQLTKISGVFPGVTSSFTHPNANTVGSGVPVGLMMRSPKGIAFGEEDFRALLADAEETGLADVFEGLSLDTDGDGNADITFDLQLPADGADFEALEPQFDALVAAINSAFSRAGFTCRAVINHAAKEVILYINGETRINQFAQLVAGGDYLGGNLPGTFVDGITTELTNVAGEVPAGQVDLAVRGDTARPTLLSAVFDTTTNLMELTFSEPVERGSVLPSLLFQLPVEGDRFGAQAAYVASDDARIVRLSLPSTTSRILNLTGEFQASAIQPGSASGIGVRVNTSAGLLSDYANNPVAPGYIDITPGSVMQLSDVMVALVNGQPAEHFISRSLTDVLSFSLTPPGAGIEVSDITVNLIVDVMGGSSTQVRANRLIGRVLLALDDDNDGMFSENDTLLDDASFFMDGSAELMISQSLASATNFLLMAEIVPDRDYIGASFMFKVSSMSGRLSNGETPTFLGLPLDPGSTLIADDRILVGNSLVFDTGAPVRDGRVGSGRYGHAATSLRVQTAPPVQMTIPRAALESSINAGAAGSPSDLDMIEIDVTADGFGDAIFSSTGGNFSGAIDTTSERTLFAQLLSTELNALANADFLVAFDADNNLTIIDRSGIYMQDSPYGVGGFVAGADVTQHLGTTFYSQSNANAAASVALVFGGKDEGGNYLNDLLAYSTANGEIDFISNVEVIGDTNATIASGTVAGANGNLPAPRFGAVMVSDGQGGALLYGGRNASTVFDDVWRLTPSYVDGDVITSSEPYALTWERLALGTGNGVHGALGLFISASANLRDALLVLGGASDVAGASPLATVRAFSLSTATWTTLTPQNTALTARWGHTGIYLEGEDQVLVFGGRSASAASSTMSDVQVLDLNGGAINEYDIIGSSVSSGSAEPWPYAFAASMQYRPSSRSVVVAGGRSSDDEIANGGALLFLEDNAVFEWRESVTNLVSDNASLEREFAPMINAEGAIYAFFGQTPSGLSDSIASVRGVRPSAYTDELTGAMAAIYMPKGSKSGGTSGSDAGEQIILLFPEGTNLLDYGSQLTQSQLSDWIELSVAGSIVELPSGTIGAVRSVLQPNDALVITLGAGIGNFQPGSSLISFAPNESADFKATTRAGQALSGDLPIFGDADASSLYLWSGMEDSDFFNPNNWLLDGELATSFPGQVSKDATVMISNALAQAGTPACFVPSQGDVGGMPEVNQLVVLGGTLATNRGFSLTSSSAGRGPLFMQAHGELRFGQFGSAGAFNIMNSSAQRPLLWSFGATDIKTLSITGTLATAKMAGTFSFSEALNVDNGFITREPESGVGATLIFKGPDAMSLQANGAQITDLVIDLNDQQSGPQSLDARNMSSGIEVANINLRAGELDMRGTEITVTRNMLVGARGSFGYGGGDSLRIDATESYALFDDTELPPITLTRPLANVVSNSEFNSGLSSWSSGSAWSLESTFGSPGSGNNSAKFSGGQPFPSTITTELNDVGIPDYQSAVIISFMHANNALTGPATLQVTALNGSTPLASNVIELDQGSQNWQWQREILIVPLSSEITNFAQIELQFSAQADGSTDRIFIDNVRVLSLANWAGDFHSSEALTLSGTYLNVIMRNSTVALDGGVNISTGSQLGVSGSGNFAIGGTLSVSSGGGFEGSGDPDALPRNLNLELKAGSSIQVDGDFATGYANWSATNDARISVSNTGSVAVNHTSFSNIGFEVDSSALRRVSGFAMDTVTFMGTPPLSTFSSSLAYIAFGETNYAEASAFTNVFLSGMSFVDQGSGIAPIEVQSASGASSANIYVRGYTSGTGFLGPITERDPQNSTGMEATTGSIRWDSSAGTLAYRSDASETSYATPGMSATVIGSFSLKPEAGEIGFDALGFQLQSSLDERMSGQQLSIKLYREMASPGFDPNDDLLLEDYGMTSLDDEEVVIFLSTAESITMETTYYLVADFGAMTPVGAFLDVYFAGIELATSAQSLTPTLRSLTGPLLGRTVVGDASTPVIYSLEHGAPGLVEEPFSGDHLIISGFNLQDAEISSIQDGSRGTVIEFDNAFSLADGSQIMNAYFVSSGSGPADTVTITVDLDGAGPGAAVTLTFQGTWGFVPQS